MSTAGKVAFGIFKWIVVPCALAYAGYAFYGPMIGKEPPKALTQITEKVTGTPTPMPTDTQAQPKEEEKFMPPEVEVNVLSRDGEKLREPTQLDSAQEL